MWITSNWYISAPGASVRASSKATLSNGLGVVLDRIIEQVGKCVYRHDGPR